LHPSPARKRVVFTLNPSSLLTVSQKPICSITPHAFVGGRLCHQNGRRDR
jgi:hypothetical protein